MDLSSPVSDPSADHSRPLLTNEHTLSSSSSPRPSLCTREMYNVLLVSFAFMLLFTAFNTIQSYVTSILPNNLGNTSLTILYGSVVVSVLLAPSIVHHIGEKRALIIGATCYVCYIASLIKIYEVIVYIASVVVGFGAAILWVAVGDFITRCSEEGKRGRNMGIFWSIFQMSAIIGNLSAWGIVNTMSTGALFAIFTIIGTCGTLLMLFLRPLPPRVIVPSPSPSTSSSTSLVSEDPSATSIRILALSVLRLYRTMPILLLVPFFAFTGLEASFWNGEFPQLVDSKVVGLVLTFVGIAEVIGGILSGFLSDRVGRSVALTIGGCIYGIGLMLAAMIKSGQYQHMMEPGIQGAPWSAYIAALCFGFADCSFNTQLYSLLGSRYPHHAVAAFASFNLIQNMGSTVGFWYAIAYPLHGSDGTYVQIYVNGILAVIACTGFLIVENRWYPGAKQNVGHEDPLDIDPIVETTHTRIAGDV